MGTEALKGDGGVETSAPVDERERRRERERERERDCRALNREQRREHYEERRDRQIETTKS